VKIERAPLAYASRSYVSARHEGRAGTRFLGLGENRSRRQKTHRTHSGIYRSASKSVRGAGESEFVEGVM